MTLKMPPDTNVCVAVKVPAPPASVTVADGAVPSPQSITDRVRVERAHVGEAAAGRDRLALAGRLRRRSAGPEAVSTGATFFTSVVRLAVALPVSSSRERQADGVDVLRRGGGIVVEVLMRLAEVGRAGGVGERLRRAFAPVDQQGEGVRVPGSMMSPLSVTTPFSSISGVTSTFATAGPRC